MPCTKSLNVGCSLAAALLPYAALPEDPVFNFCGKSSSGKTTAARIGTSFQGHPEAIRSWDQKARALEESAGDRNNLLLVLNAAERSPLRERQLVLSRITHMLSEGESTKRSRGVKELYANLKWATLTLSTSNAPGSEMAQKMKMSWNEQEQARFIDFPVPLLKSGASLTTVGNMVPKILRSSCCKLVRHSGPPMVGSMRPGCVTSGTMSPPPWSKP